MITDDEVVGVALCPVRLVSWTQRWTLQAREGGVWDGPFPHGARQEPALPALPCWPPERAGGRVCCVGPACVTATPRETSAPGPPAPPMPRMRRGIRGREPPVSCRARLGLTFCFVFEMSRPLSSIHTNSSFPVLVSPDPKIALTQEAVWGALEPGSPADRKHPSRGQGHSL